MKRAPPIVLRFLLASRSATAILALLIWGVGGTASAQSSEDAGTIQEIKPTLHGLNVSVHNLTVEYGQRLGLSVIVIGPNGNKDQSRASIVDFVWTASFGEVEVHDDTTRATYVAPRVRAGDTVSVTAGPECVGNTTDCTATFKIRVLPPGPPYGQNPPGEIPTALEDAQGNQYAVFTPEEGGTFNGGEFWVSASRGDVPNGEFIGVRMFENGPASNAGVSHHRYTFSGNQYKIPVVDAEGIPIASYTLDRTVGACIPVPDDLRSNLSSIVMVTKNNDGTLTVVSSSFRISPSLIICGYTSTLPATIAVGIPGTPPPLLEPVPQLPRTGGAAPSSTAVLVWATLIGVALLATGIFAVSRRRRNN